jgi:hypothetical protein
MGGWIDHPKEKKETRKEEKRKKRKKPPVRGICALAVPWSILDIY